MYAYETSLSSAQSYHWARLRESSEKNLQIPIQYFVIAMPSNCSPSVNLSSECCGAPIQSCSVHFCEEIKTRLLDFDIVVRKSLYLQIFLSLVVAQNLENCMHLYKNIPTEKKNFHLSKLITGVLLLISPFHNLVLYIVNNYGRIPPRPLIN